MAASTVMRLQTIRSREVAGNETAVVTVGAIRAGTKANFIPRDAELLISVRSYDDGVRTTILDGINRIVAAEADASNAPRPPTVTTLESYPTVVKDPQASARTKAAFDARFGPGRVVDPGQVTGSEDVGMLATAAGAPLVFWLLGGADPALFAGASTVADMIEAMSKIPSNHSPHYAPVNEPTLQVGIDALAAAAKAWLPAR